MKLPYAIKSVVDIGTFSTRNPVTGSDGPTGSEAFQRETRFLTKAFIPAARAKTSTVSLRIIIEAPLDSRNAGPSSEKTTMA